ncbi:galectin-3-binding protein A-like [Oncorhynchus keta]|uniref:galectin-3-binding protein A-like n=1 Tax=Oncorhynchus keta TaxID=8018 RepID=UPI0015FDA87D|nr:galectin-3-binding protein A-like [Oncorhynchus keta]
MRLVGGKLSSEGCVEFYYNGQWGTMCEDNSDIIEAQVVCCHLTNLVLLLPWWLEYTDKLGWICITSLVSTHRSFDSMKNISRVYTLDHNTGLANHMGGLFESGQASILNVTKEENFINFNLDVRLNCRPHFTNFLSPEDSSFQTSLYEHSVCTGDPVLQETCLRYLAWSCKSLSHSPAWTGLGLGTVKTLLARSYVVVPEEAFLLKGLEDWVLDQGNSSTHEAQVALLECIPFPMIAA